MWVSAKGMPKNRKRADIELNRFLETVCVKLLAIYTKMVAESTLINSDTMKKRVLGSDEKPKMFLEVLRENNTKYRKRFELGDIAERMVLRWERYTTYLKRFLPLLINTKDIPLQDVTHSLIDDFCSFAQRRSTDITVQSATSTLSRRLCMILSHKSGLIAILSTAGLTPRRRQIVSICLVMNLMP